MACLISILTILIYILQSTDCHIVRDIGQHTENFFRFLSFNLEDEAYNQESIDKPININFQEFLNSFPNKVDDGSSIASASNDQHDLQLARSSNQDFLKSHTSEVDDGSSIASATNDQHGLRLTRSSYSRKRKKTIFKRQQKSGHSSNELQCYFSVNYNSLDVKNNTLDVINNTLEIKILESKYWKTCTNITHTLNDMSGKQTTVVHSAVSQEYDTGCITDEHGMGDGYGVVITTCYCNWDGCNPATNQAMFSSILLMTLPAVILVTPMVHTRFL